MARAHDAIEWRKKKEAIINFPRELMGLKKAKMADKIIDKSVIPEHEEYMRSLVGVAGLDVKPLLLGGRTTTLAQFTQNMLEPSVGGTHRFAQYLQALGEGAEVSLDIYIDRDQLPAIIDFLRHGPQH